MTRQNRIIGESGYYHIYSRGVNKQIIYEQDSDYIKFINLTKHYSTKFKVKIIAYCVMPNHFHFLIYDPFNKKSKFMHGLKQTYTQFYNLKYGRVGTLFDNRYKCKTIEREDYLKTVFQYILLNPERANICEARNYKWNSYVEYHKDDTFLAMDKVKEIVGQVENIDSICNNEDGNFVSLDEAFDNIKISNILMDKYKIGDRSILVNLSDTLLEDITKTLAKEKITRKKISDVTKLSRGRVDRILHVQ